MDKRILKKIAKEWAAGILFHGTGADSFDDEVEGMLNEDEQFYVVDEVQRLGLTLMKNIGESPSVNLEEIIKKYYEIE